MALDYVFDSKMLEEFSDKIKAMIFDIISVEKTQSDSSFYGDLKEQIEEIYSYQGKCLDEVMATTNQLVTLLQELDGYRKDIRDIQNNKNQEIVNNYYGQKTEDDKSSKDNNKQEEVPEEASDMTKEEADKIIQDYINSINIPGARDSSSSNYENSSRLNENSKKDNSSTETDEVDTTSKKEKDVSSDAVSVEGEDVENNNEDKSIDIKSDDTNNDNSNMEKDEKNSDTVPKEENESMSIKDIVIEGSTDALGEEEKTDSNEEKIDTSEKEEVQEPLIPVDNTDDKKEESEEEINSDGVVLPFRDDNNTSDGIVEVNTDTEEEGPLVKIPKEKVVFEKDNSNDAKAILVSKNQRLNLDKSRDVQAALFQSLNNSDVFDINNSQDENQEELSFEEMQKKIEIMMEEANKLYQEGKVAEAQEKYEEISKLNKQIQNGDSVHVRGK